MAKPFLNNSIQFSIIIPTLNVADMIADCLNSFLCQTLPSFEILIVDGGSTDDSLAIIERINHPNIKIYRFNKLGIYEAMNFGIEQAQSDWLYFIGADDTLYDATVLAQVSNYIHHHNQTEIVYGNVQSPLFHKGKKPYDGVFSKSKILQKNICHQAIFYKKSVFQTIGLYDGQFRISADYIFNLKCFFDFDITIQHIDKTIANYSADGISSTQKDKLFEQKKYGVLLQYAEHLPFSRRVWYTIRHYINVLRYA